MIRSAEEVDDGSKETPITELTGDDLTGKPPVEKPISEPSPKGSVDNGDLRTIPLEPSSNSSSDTTKSEDEKY